jgi:hypothetical protein
MACREYRDLLVEWCEAQDQYDVENFTGGFPSYVTAHRLYHAGRALFAAVGVTAIEGRYSLNRYFENPSTQTQGLLDAQKKSKSALP